MPCGLKVLFDILHDASGFVRTVIVKDDICDMVSQHVFVSNRNANLFQKSNQIVLVRRLSKHKDRIRNARANGAK